MSLYNAYMNLSGAIDGDVVLDERLAHRTTLRIGGPAALTITAHSYPALAKSLGVLGNEGVEWVIMGRGSNVLIADEGYRGCVIRLGREFQSMSIGEDGQVSVGAGMLLSKLVSAAQRAGLSGLEPCVGIPGTVGGAVSMNAGTAHEWIGARVAQVVVHHPGEGLVAHDGSRIEWTYRGCSLEPSEVILEARLSLVPSTPAAVAEDMERRMARRRDTQPMGRPSCGSVFRNPPDGSAAALIEACGLKGASEGAAQVSDVHANFIVNNGGATARDVIALMRRMHDEVLDRQGVDLAPEVKFLGFR